MLDTRKPLRAQILRWAQRTPVHTFVMCPLLVIAFELALRCWHGDICNIFSLGITGCLVQAGLPAWMQCQRRSSRPAHIATRVIRCISATSSSWRDSSLRSGRGSRSSCLLLAQRGSSGGFCTTRRGSKGRSALNIPRTGPGRSDGSHSYCDAATRRGGTTSPGTPDSKRTRVLKTGEKYDEST